MIKFDLTFARKRAIVVNRLPLAIALAVLALTMTRFGNGLLAIPIIACFAVAGWLAWRPITRAVRLLPGFVYGTPDARIAHRGKSTFAQLRRRVTASRAAWRTTRHLAVDRGWPLPLTFLPATIHWGWVFLTVRS